VAKRANGECYHSTEKYSPDHKCVAKGVFLLEPDDEVMEEDAVELDRSLHVLTGIDIADMMELWVCIHSVSLLAWWTCGMVDTGSTHTFIQELWRALAFKWNLGRV
jgi:hypothetical protein